MTNTQLSCSGGGEPNRILNTFKDAMDLPQGTRWEITSDKEIASLEKQRVFKLIPDYLSPCGTQGFWHQVGVQN